MRAPVQTLNLGVLRALSKLGHSSLLVCLVRGLSVAREWGPLPRAAQRFIYRDQARHSLGPALSQAIIGFQAVQFMLADMATDIAASRLLIHHAARLHDAGEPIAKEAAQAKLFTTDMAMKHVSNALQIHGGNGYSRHYRIERLFRDVRLAQIYELFCQP